MLAAGRLLIRLRIIKGFYWDDFFAMFSLVLLIPFAALNTISAPYSYEFAAMSEGTAPMLPPDQVSAIILKLEKYGFAAEAFFWTTLFLVKLSLLCLYRELLKGVGHSMKIWWASFVFVIISYGICIVGWLAQCGRIRDDFNPGMSKCIPRASTSLTDFVNRNLRGVARPRRSLHLDADGFQCRHRHPWYVAHRSQDRRILSAWPEVFADTIPVMALPLRTLYNLNARWSQKAAVMGVFAMALVTIAFEILRAVEFYKLFTFYTTLYTSLQVSFAVIISMLPPYGAIISNSKDHRARRHEFWRLITLRSTGSSGRSFALHSMPSGEQNSRQASGAGLTHSEENVPKMPHGKYGEDWEVRAV